MLARPRLIKSDALSGWDRPNRLDSSASVEVVYFRHSIAAMSRPLAWLRKPQYASASMPYTWAVASSTSSIVITVISKIERTGLSGTYIYSVAADRKNRPVNFVSYFDAMRFTNWLENGQPTGA